MLSVWIHINEISIQLFQYIGADPGLKLDMMWQRLQDLC